MEWDKLLQREKRDESRPERSGAASRDGDSLIRQICGQIGTTGRAETEDEAISAEGRTSLPDGYMRRAPVQRYYTPPDFTKKRVLKAVLIAAGLCFAALLALALLKSGLFRFQ